MRKPLPSLALVAGHRHSAVVADQHVVRVVRIDPHRVMVDVNPLGAVEPKGLAAVVRHAQGRFRQVHAEVILGIDPDDPEIHWPAVMRPHLPPGGAGVVGPIDPALFLMLDPGVDDVRIAPVDVEPDPSERPFGKAPGQLRPGPTRIGCFPDPAVGPAAVEAEAGPPPLVGGRVDHLVVARIHDQVGTAGVGPGIEDPGPGNPAVGCLVNAALAPGVPQVAECRDIHHLVVFGIDHDSRHLSSLAEAQVLPALGPIGRLVDAVAPGAALAVVVFTGADPHQVGVVARNRDVADRHPGRRIEHRGQGDAAVDRLPEPAGGGRDIEDVGVPFQHREVVDPAARPGRADVPELEFVEGTTLPGGVGSLGRKGQDEQRRVQEQGANLECLSRIT